MAQRSERGLLPVCEATPTALPQFTAMHLALRPLPESSVFYSLHHTRSGLEQGLISVPSKEQEWACPLNPPLSQEGLCFYQIISHKFE